MCCECLHYGRTWSNAPLSRKAGRRNQPREKQPCLSRVLGSSCVSGGLSCRLGIQPGDRAVLEGGEEGHQTPFHRGTKGISVHSTHRGQLLVQEVLMLFLL